MCAPFYSNEPIDTLDLSRLTTEELLNDELGLKWGGEKAPQTSN